MILSDASKLNREQLQQNLSLRVRLFKRTAEATAVGGSIAMATGIITLSRRSWVKRVRFEHEAEGLDVKIWFSHDGATFQLWHTEVDYESDAALDLPVSIYCKYLKVKGITEAGEEIEAISDTWLVYDEATFDISGDVRDGVTVERKKDRELGFYVMPYASIPLDNTHGYFHKRNTASPYWDADHGKSFLRSSARIFVEAMYKGPDGRLPLNGEGDPDWIPVVMFEAQRFRNNAEGRLLTVSGYGAKVLLRGNTTQPVHELITPVDLVKDWLVRDDDTGRLLVPVNPASRQVTQTKFSEFVGRGRTFAGNWWDALPIEHGQVMSVPGGQPASYNDDSDAFAVVTGFADGTYKRTGICTDGSFLYALLCFVEDQNNDTDWFIEKMDFEGNVVGKLQVDTPGYFEYMADITTDGEYLYYTVNRVHVNPIFAQEVRKVPLDLSSAPSVLKRWSYYENPAHPPQALYGITFVNEESATHPGRLIIFSRVLTNLGGYSAADLLYVMNRSTGSYDVMNNSALGAFAFLDYMDQVTDEFIVLHSEGSNYYTLRLADVDLDWRDELVEFASTLPDKGGAIFSDRKKFIFLLRTDLGIGKVAEFGYWLENANLQYTGIAGFDRPLLYLRPVILLDGQATEADGTVTDALLTTDDYALNLRTGQLRFRFLLRDGVEIRAHYDYVYSLRYVRIEDKKRIEALNDVGISNNFQVFLDETGEIQFRNRRYEEVLPCPTVSQDLLPDETVENNWTVLGGPTAHGVLADESDDTYLHTGVVLSKRAVVGFENPAYPFDTGERVKLRVRARMSGFEVRLLTITIRDGGSFIVSTVLNLGINFEWYELLGPVGYVPGSNGANLRAVLDTGDYHSIDVSQCRMVFPMESVQSKRLGDPYQDGGLDYIVHPSNPAHRFNTVRVSSVDRVRRFVEGADFTIAYTGNRSFITFLDTETVRESEVAGDVLCAARDPGAEGCAAYRAERDG